MPQPKAHIGANQVIGFSSSSTAAGRARAARLAAGSVALMPLPSAGEVAQAVATQLDVEALPAEAEHLGGRGAVVAGQLQRRLDAQPLDHVGRLAHQVLQRDAADQFGRRARRSGAGRGRRAARSGGGRHRGWRSRSTACRRSSPRRRRSPHRRAGAVVAPHGGGEQPDRAALAQVAEQHGQIDAGPAEPAFERLAARLFLGGELRHLEEGGVGGDDPRRPTSVTTKPSGAFSTTFSSLDLVCGSTASAADGADRRQADQEQRPCFPGGTARRRRSSSRSLPARRVRTSSARPDGADGGEQVQHRLRPPSPSNRSAKCWFCARGAGVAEQRACRRVGLHHFAARRRRR